VLPLFNNEEISSMKRRMLAAVALALLLSIALFSVASAHAELVSSDPAAGAKLTAAPTKVTLVFSEEISADATATNFTVTDAKGASVGTGKLDNTDLDHKTQTGTLSAGLGDGVYTVTWNAVTTDDNGHTTGSFTFGVNADPGAQQPTAAPEEDEATAVPSATTSAAPTAAPVATASAAPTASAVPTATPAAPTTLPRTGGSGTDLSMYFLLAAIVLVAGGFALLKRRA
jgi:LPXTG-motif cell wall-anchored protein